MKNLPVDMLIMLLFICSYVNEVNAFNKHSFTASKYSVSVDLKRCVGRKGNFQLKMSTSESSDPEIENSSQISPDSTDDLKNNPKSIKQKISSIFSTSKGGLTKDDLAKLGQSALLSYGAVSNFSYVTTVIIAFIIHGKTFKLSPFVPGQKSKMFAIYTGLWAANNILRPLRFSISVVIAPFFERLVSYIEKISKVPRGYAFGITVFLVNVCGTFSYLFGGIFLASIIAKVPLFP